MYCNPGGLDHMDSIARERCINRNEDGKINLLKKVVMILHCLTAWPFGKHVDMFLVLEAIRNSEPLYTDDEFADVLAFMKMKRIINICEEGHLVLTEQGYKEGRNITNTIKSKTN